MRRFIIVTGASSGIGHSACLALIKAGYEVIAGVRTAGDSEKLKSAGGDSIHPVIMDVTDPISMTRAKAATEEIIVDGSLVAIINNAGIVVSGAALYIPPEEWAHQLDVNVLGVIRTTQLFFPLLALPRAQGDIHPRRIINMSSISGLFASPFLGPYVTSKHALEGLSDSLRRELYMFDIQVVIIEPGNISTPIWSKARKAPAYFGPEHDSILAFKEQLIDIQIARSIPVVEVDNVILKAVSAKKVKVRYQVMQGKWKFNLIRCLPTKWVDTMIGKRLRDKSGIRPF